MAFQDFLSGVGTDGDFESWQDRRDLVFEFIDSSYDQQELDEFLADDKMRYFEISEKLFLQMALSTGEIRYEDYRPKYKYHLQQNHLEVDQYVNQVLKKYFPETKQWTEGYTRSARYGCMLNNILRFAQKLTSKRALFQNPQLYEWYLDSIHEFKKMWISENNGKKFETRTLKQALDLLPLNTAAGYSYPGKKKYQVVDQALLHASQMKSRIERGQFQKKLPCTLAMRGHLSRKNENKSRAVWVMPFETVILEASLFSGFYRVLKKSNKLPFITGENSMQRLWLYMEDHPQHKMVTNDISSWDSMRGKFLMYDALTALGDLIDLDFKESKLFKWIVHDMVETHFMLPSGIVLSKSTGIPSGTYLTLLINCTINWIVQRTVLKYLKIEYYDLQVLGDDNSYKTPFIHPNKLEQVSAVLKEYFGMLMHPDKVEIFHNVGERKYLGYRYQGLRLVRKTEEWFRLVCLPEREVTSLSISFTRVFSYLLIGGINDSLYVSFYEKYLNVYLDKLKAIGYLAKEIFTHGSLRVFKHALNLDLDYLASINIEKVLRFNYFFMPFMFSCNYEISETLFLNEIL